MSARSHPDADRLDAYLLDELGVEKRTAVEDHLTDCKECRAQVRLLRRTLSTYASAEHPPPPPEVLAKLLAVQRRLRPESRERYVRTEFWSPARFLAAAVTAIGIFLGGFWLGQQQVLPGMQATVEDSLAIRSPVAIPPEVVFQTVAADGLRGLAYSDTTGI